MNPDEDTFFAFSTFETYQVLQDFRGLKKDMNVKFIRESRNVYDSEIIFSFRQVDVPDVLEVILHITEKIHWSRYVGIIS